ncbi:MAG: glycerol-3-phosphate dehydrogenase/oxidase [Alphaproteobacteria bacterium]|nr:glycerol-3-phosphate dehydrogenase/oxidase [Alphaproteobacteria bacterium]
MAPELPSRLQEQQRRLQALQAAGVDVLIIGAGINGAGLFRDLCEQGVSCAIVDKGDFGSGTSAAPSRLIHGGLKYIETGELGLVAQSTYERNLLLKNAPHCVKPIETVVPIFSWAKGVWPALKTLAGFKATARSRGALLIKVGLALYDFYGARARVMPRHAMWSRQRALRELPSLAPTIVAAGTYYDAAIARPERLVWELLQDGLAANPNSAALNYCALQDCDGRALQFESQNGFAFSLCPRIVINAAGPWIDAVNEKLGAPTKLIGGTKGSHILIDHPELLRQLQGRMVYFESNDGRILLIYPYEGHVMVGSTDQKAANPDDVACEDWEIDYFLGALRILLPAMHFDGGQIIYAYSGIRPLPASDASSEGLISRDHSAPVMEPADKRAFPVISLVGGKWTTFRGFAEEVADAVLQRLQRPRRLSTATLAIGGGRDYPAEAETWISVPANKFGIPAEDARTLFMRYGTTASALLENLAASGLGERLQDAPDYFVGEFRYMARRELVQTLADTVMRRTVLALGGQLSLRGIHAIAGVLAEELGWSEARKIKEVSELASALRTRNRIRLAGPDKAQAAA